MEKTAAVTFCFLWLLLLLVFATPASSSSTSLVPHTEATENSWTSKAPMQQARAGLGVVAVNGKIYAIGGTTASGQYPPDVSGGGFAGTNEEYDPATNTWTTKASMPTPRDYFAIAAYQNKIYCIGGAVGFTFDERSGFYSYIPSGVNEVYDTVANTWVTKTPMPDEGGKFQAHVINGKIYVIRGSYSYVYDPADDSWAPTERMPPPYPSSSLVSAVVDNKIIVTGEFQTGYPLRSEQKILIYDTETDTWSEGTSGPTIVIDGAAGATTGVKAPQKVYVLGLAYGQFPPPSTNQVYDPKTDAWRTANAMPTLRRDFGVAVVDDVLYAIGGYSYTSHIYATVTPVAVNEQYTPIGYGTVPPAVAVVSPENKTYTVNYVSLTFNVDKPTSWMGYSLDGKANVTITGNRTLTWLSDGMHSLTVYAKDTAGNTGASETIYFSIKASPTWIVAATAIIVVVGALLVYFAKVKKTTGKAE